MLNAMRSARSSTHPSCSVHASAGSCCDAMARDHAYTPLQSLQHSLVAVGSQVASNWSGITRHVQTQAHTGLQQLSHHVHCHLRRQQQASHWPLALASLSLGGGLGPSSSGRSGVSNSSRTASTSARGTVQPLFDLAMPKDEVKARLAPIPVYTVANPKNEFVLVAGENNTQLGFFFFRKEDAESIIEKIKDENPRLARDSKILRVTMDNVYEVFTTPREQTGLQGIHFRFMPEMQQVRHALQLYKDAGVPTSTFIGVPVFQAEGLTVTTQEMQYVPLFLCKEDLDVAVQSAYRQRNAAQIKVVRDKASKYETEYQEAARLADAAAGRDKVNLETKAAKARTKMDSALEKATAIERAPLPKVEVGSFEEVIMRMTAAEGSELAAWSQVMFVAPGLLQQTAVAAGTANAPALEEAASKKK